MHGWRSVVVWVVCVGIAAGCGDSGQSGEAAAGSAAESAAAVKAESGYIVGRVLDESGKPLTYADDIGISIMGISEAGEKIQYSPGIKPDGAYRQKVVPGSYKFGTARAKIRFEPHVFAFDLKPVGNDWRKDRDAKDGITQDYVYHMTGVRTQDKPDPNNHTHWYGMSIGVRLSGYRDDIKKPTVAPPDGTKFVFTLTPKSKLITGAEAKEIKLERTWRAKDITLRGERRGHPARRQHEEAAPARPRRLPELQAGGPGDADGRPDHRRHGEVELELCSGGVTRRSDQQSRKTTQAGWRLRSPPRLFC
jgi:hypothetical protein